MSFSRKQIRLLRFGAALLVIASVLRGRAPDVEGIKRETNQLKKLFNFSNLKVCKDDDKPT